METGPELVQEGKEDTNKIVTFRDNIGYCPVSWGRDENPRRWDYIVIDGYFF